AAAADLKWPLPDDVTDAALECRLFARTGNEPGQRLLVPDNLKSGVNKASFYDPEINRTYGAMAAHYAVGILPTRPRKPRDKAKVESELLRECWAEHRIELSCRRRDLRQSPSRMRNQKMRISKRIFARTEFLPSFFMPIMARRIA